MEIAHRNIPTDVIRTVVAVAEMGSLTQAAKSLRLSQPAVTSQIKRIEETIGGSLFTKSSNGSVPTDLGKLFLEHARRMLDANDQMLRLGGHLAREPQQVRLGISSIFIDDFLTNQNARSVSNVTVQIDDCFGIAKSLVDSHIDIACIQDNSKFDSDILNLVIGDCTEPMAWVCSPDFSLSPGKSLPLLIWPGDNFLVNELTKRGLPFKVVFTSKDYHSKLKAAAAGIGITAMPRRMIPDSLIAIDEDYLPNLQPIRGLLCARPNLSLEAQVIAKRIAARYFRAVAT